MNVKLSDINILWVKIGNFKTPKYGLCKYNNEFYTFILLSETVVQLKSMDFLDKVFWVIDKFLFELCVSTKYSSPPYIFTKKFENVRDVSPHIQTILFRWYNR